MRAVAKKRRPLDYLIDALRRRKQLDPQQRLAAFVIGSYLNNDTRVAFPSEDTVAEELGVGVRRTREVVDALCTPDGPFERGTVPGRRVNGQEEVKGSFRPGEKGGRGRLPAVRLRDWVMAERGDSLHSGGSSYSKGEAPIACTPEADSLHLDLDSEASMAHIRLRTTSNYRNNMEGITGSAVDATPLTPPVVARLTAVPQRRRPQCVNALRADPNALILDLQERLSGRSVNDEESSSSSGAGGIGGGAEGTAAGIALPFNSNGNGASMKDLVNDILAQLEEADGGGRQHGVPTASAVENILRWIPEGERNLAPDVLAWAFMKKDDFTVPRTFDEFVSRWYELRDEHDAETDRVGGGKEVA